MFLSDDSPYVCLDCGLMFKEPKHYVERHGLDTPPYEHYSGCPSCGGAYAHTFSCDCCGNPITGEYIKVKDGRVYCEECYTVMDIADNTF